MKSILQFFLFVSFNYCFGQSIYYQTVDSLEKNQHNRIETTTSEIAGAGLSKSIVPIGINPLIIFEGITQFAIDQFKSDLVDGFLNRFLKYIDQYGELRLLFQETYSQLNNIKEISSSELSNQFRTAFHKDLFLLPSRIANHLENPIDANFPGLVFLNKKNIDLFKKNEKFEYLQFSLKLLDYLLNYYHPQNAIEMLDATLIESHVRKNENDKCTVKELIHLLNIVQSAFREKSKIINGQTDNIWINFEQLKAINNDVGKKIFVTKIYRTDPLFFGSLLDTNDNSYKEIFFTKTIKILEVCQSLQEFARQSNQEKKNFIAYVNLFSNLISATEAFFNSTDSNIFNVFNKVGSIYTSIHDGSFNLLFTNLIDLVNLFCPDAYKDKDWIKMQRLLNKYFSFSIALVNSKNAEEVKEAISSHVKVNANRALKRNSAYGLTLNINPGLIASFECKKHSKPRHNFGVSLPIGLDFYFNWPGKKVNSQSPSNKNLYYAHGSSRIPSRNYSSITFSVIDLGAFLTYGISGKPWDSIPNKKVNVLNVMSPGISINQSIAGFPITIGMAYRYTPELRKLQEDLYPRRHQFNLNLMWDIPLFSIINKSYDIKKYN